MSTFTEMLQVQCDQMLAVARRLDERGYAVVVHGLNADGADNRYLYKYFDGALAEYIECIGRRCTGSRMPTIVHVHPTDPDRRKPDNPAALRARGGKLLDHSFNFMMQLPQTKRYKELVAALDFVCQKKEKRGSTEIKGVGILLATSVSDYIEYTGSGRAAFEILIRYLEMPQHRAILKNERA